MFKFTNIKEKHEMLIGGVDACKVCVLSLLGLLVLSYVPSHDDIALCLVSTHWFINGHNFLIDLVYTVLPSMCM
jgi:hypothetical protein